MCSFYYTDKLSDARQCACKECQHSVEKDIQDLEKSLQDKKDYLKKMKDIQDPVENILRDLKNCEGRVDFKNGFVCYCLVYNFKTQSFHVYEYTDVKYINGVYFRSEASAKMAIKTVGVDRLKRLFTET